MEFIHRLSDSTVNIYEMSETKLTGTFFSKQKPNVGDFIMSHTKRIEGGLCVYQVTEIIENRDAKVQKDFPYDPKDSFFELGIMNVTGDKRFAEVDNRIQRLTQN